MHVTTIQTAHFHFAPGASPEALASLERAMQGIGRASIGDDTEQPIQVVSTLPKIGEYWEGQGGIFAGDFRADDGTVYGLIVADCGTAQDAGRARHCENGERDLSQWDGMDNTQRLKNGCPAALLATQHVADGHDDFYLPARRELQLACANVPHLFGADSWYWSSTPYGESSAWAVDFDCGFTDDRHRHNEFRVRPFRRFIYLSLHLFLHPSTQEHPHGHHPTARAQSQRSPAGRPARH